MILVSFSSSPASAGYQRATCEEARQNAINAAFYLREHGIEKAREAFHRSGGPFRNRDLYVVVLNDQGVNLVHPLMPRIQNKSMMHIKDIQGFAYAKAFMSIKSVGWISYMYPCPYEGTRPERKRTYLIREGQYLVGSGCYGEQTSPLKSSFALK